MKRANDVSTARAEEGNPHLVDLRDFQVFIVAIYGEKRSIGWADIILKNCGGEEEAFWKFYEFYEEFERGQKTVECFVKQYVDDSILGDNKLIWNSLKQKVSENIVTLSNDEGIEKVRKLAPKELFLYDERQKLLQKVTIGKVLGVLSRLEVWEEKDLYVFDVSILILLNRWKVMILKWLIMSRRLKKILSGNWQRYILMPVLVAPILINV